MPAQLELMTNIYYSAEPRCRMAEQVLPWLKVQMELILMLQLNHV